MDGGIVALILFGSLLLFMGLGIPVAFTLGGLSLIFGFFFWDGLSSVDGFVLGSFGKVSEFTLSALPLYILMAAILRYSDLAEDMYEAIYRWLGGIKGGLAAGTNVVSSIFGSMTGIATVATATLGVTARPSMLKRGYDSKLISGTIVAGGSLGVLLPPSIIMILYASEAGVSTAALFFAGIGPGILATLVFMAYVLIVCYIKPEMGPSIDKANRFTFGEKLTSLKGILLPVSIIILVLGTIYTGVATPTEAASVGVMGAVVSAGIKKKMNWSNIKQMFMMTVRINGMVFWLLIGATAYARIVTVSGVGDWFAGTITGLDVNRWLILVGILLIFFILGMFIDPAGILLMTAPLFLPVITGLDFDPIWFGVLFIITMCMGYMTPPFGFNLFVLRGVAPDISIRELYVSVWPFVGLYILVIILVMVFPNIALWLPDNFMN
ncbi:TRAP transporter large permease subunit [Salicibibacter cibarius]|uniref:TRAP transporter large permease subunit n=1 Tax=Salicibibacter cibarius TaxID=2743000 RepID=A0A7T6Z434_9BACI|nr:TRAP transporter large permease subunit [Salicibibacter cibarius]QQK76431.1 TRAP transporter large permease subunit [Salicibibacter cibarius]